MEGALPTIAYNRGGGGGIGAVIFDKPSIDPLEALNLTIQREQQAEQQKAANQERQLNRTYQMLKDIDFDVSGVYDYDLPMFRERTEALNKKAGQVLQKYANKPELQGEFLNEWQRDIRGEYNDLKLLMEESKSDKETVAKALQLYAANPQKYDEGVDAAVAQINLLPVGGRTKDGLSRKQLAMGALKPSFNENKYIADWVSKIDYDQEVEEKTGAGGSKKAYTTKFIPIERVYNNAQQLYGGNKYFKENVDGEFDALLNSQDPADKVLAQHYIDKAQEVSQSTGLAYSPMDIYVAEKKVAPLIGQQASVKGLLGRAPQPKSEASAQGKAKQMQDQANLMYRYWTDFSKGDANTINNLVTENAVVKNPDGSYSASFATEWQAPADFYVEGGKTVRVDNNKVLDLRLFPDGTMRVKTTASAIKNDIAKETKGDVVKNPEYMVVSPKYLQSIMNANGGKIYGGLPAYEKAKGEYEKVNRQVSDVRKEGRPIVGKLVTDKSGQTYIPADVDNNGKPITAKGAMKQKVDTPKTKVVEGFTMPENAIPKYGAKTGKLIGYELPDGTKFKFQ